MFRMQYWFVFCFAMAMVANYNRLAYAQDFRRHLVGKTCGRCGSAVAMTSQVGMRCNHCGAYWGGERERVIGRNFATSTESPRELQEVNEPSKDVSPPMTIVKSPCGKYSAQSTRGGFARVFDQNGSHILTLPHAGKLCGEVFSRNDEMIAVATDGSASLYELPLGVRRCRLAKNGVLAAVFLPGENDVIMIIKERVIYFKNGVNQLVNHRITGSRHGGGFGEVIFTSDSHGPPRLFIREKDGRTAVRDIATGQRLASSFRPGVFHTNTIGTTGLSQVKVSVGQ